MTKEVKEKNELVDVIPDDMSKIIDAVKIKQSDQPVEIEGLDVVDGFVKVIEKNYGKLVFSDDKQIEEVMKKGGILQGLRKAHRVISDYKGDYHRKARESYSDADKQINEMLSRVGSVIDHIKESTDAYQMKKKDEQYSRIKERWDKQHALPEYKELDVEFNDFFDDRMLNKGQSSDKVIESNVVNYFKDKLDDYQEIMKLSNSMTGEGSKVWLETAKRAFSVGLPVKDAVLKADYEKNKFEENLKLEKIKAENLEKEKNEEKKKTKDTKKQPKKVKDHIYMFAIPDAHAAKTIKAYLDKHGYDYRLRTKEIDLRQK